MAGGENARQPNVASRSSLQRLEEKPSSHSLDLKVVRWFRMTMR